MRIPRSTEILKIVSQRQQLEPVNITQNGGRQVSIRMLWERILMCAGVISLRDRVQEQAIVERQKGP